MASLKDIAQHCGVSIATVSKALNGMQDIGEETRRRVLEAAETLGYTSNAAARALKTNRTYNLGVLFVDEQHSGLSHEYFSQVLDSLRVEAERRGYDITFINNSVGQRRTSYLQHALYRGVDGVAVICVDYFDPMVLELVRSSLPVVTIDHSFNNRTAVMSDNLAGPEALVRYACEKGHRRIAFIHGERTDVTENRLTGFYRACEALGLTVPDGWVLQGRYHHPKSCYELTRRLLAAPERPSCILFPDDFSSIGGLNAIYESGLRVPEDLSVIGYDGIYLSRVISPRLCTWRQNTGELGRIAAERLIELIEHPRTTAQERCVVSGELLEGGSVAAPAER